MSHIKPSNGANVFISDRFPHAGDWYLHHVLAKFNGQWVPWVFNEIDNACCHGHYFDKVTDALDDYGMRRGETNRNHKQELAELACEQAMHEASIASLYEGVAQ